jgi:hypothetical protein
MANRTVEDLQAGLDYIRQSPLSEGTLELIVRRPDIGVREVLEEGSLDATIGLIGDNWSVKASTATPDGAPDPAGQITLMNARTAGLIAGQRDRWALAGDQLYVDLDLSNANLPPGTRLAIGAAVVELTAKPHLGCAKFAARFGRDALRFVNTGPGRLLNLRGRNARVVVPGTVRRGDLVRRLVPAATDGMATPGNSRPAAVAAADGGSGAGASA